jgi:hypothetical protein
MLFLFHIFAIQCVQVAYDTKMLRRVTGLSCIGIGGIVGTTIDSWAHEHTGSTVVRNWKHCGTAIKMVRRG